MTNHPWQQPCVQEQTQRLIHSYSHWTGSRLLTSLNGDQAQQAKNLFYAPFVVVSHGTQADPIFNYANQQALTLWETTWEEFTQMPSRLSAEPIAQTDRSRLLAQAKCQGYLQGHKGIRISQTGRRFWIENVTLWDVLTETGAACGQAATFSQWKFIH